MITSTKISTNTRLSHEHAWISGHLVPTSVMPYYIYPIVGGPDDQNFIIFWKNITKIILKHVLGLHASQVKFLHLFQGPIQDSKVISE